MWLRDRERNEVNRQRMDVETDMGCKVDGNVFRLFDHRKELMKLI